jgi:hypothetical protein
MADIMLADAGVLAVATGKPADDPRLLLELRRASARFIGEVGRPIIQVVGETVVLDGSGTETLLLPDWPVSDLTVNVEGVPVTDFEVSAPSGVLRRYARWPDKLGAIAVLYTHGYDPIPADIADAVLEQAQIALNTIVGVQQTSQGSRSVTFGAASTTGVTQRWSDTVARYSARGDEC